MIVDDIDLETVSLVRAVMDQVPPKDRVSNHNVIVRDFAEVVRKMKKSREEAALPESTIGSTTVVWALMFAKGKDRTLPEIFTKDEYAIHYAKEIMKADGKMSETVAHGEFIIVRSLDGSIEAHINPMIVMR